VSKTENVFRILYLSNFLYQIKSNGLKSEGSIIIKLRNALNFTSLPKQGNSYIRPVFGEMLSLVQRGYLLPCW